MDGVLVLDKPEGLTSHDVVAAARRLLRESRIGHTGTLDPLATGVLPLVCGRATRLARFLTASDKDYEATIVFGVATDTYDITGRETSRSDGIPSRDAVGHALQALSGEYLQVPPAFSAKKVGGRKAYELARHASARIAEGEAPDAPVAALEAVPVRVSRVELVGFVENRATVHLTCSAGFYVRTFAHALGELTGTGACLEALRRTRSGDFRIEQAVPLSALADATASVVPLEQLLPSFPAVTVTDEGRQRVAHGRPIEEAQMQSGGPERGGWMRVFDLSGALVALATPVPASRALHPSVVLI